MPKGTEGHLTVSQEIALSEPNLKPNKSERIYLISLLKIHRTEMN